MTDKELDEMLNAWKTPPVPASLREGVQAGIAAKRDRTLRKLFPRWRWLIATASVAAVVLMIANTSASSRKFGLSPYIVQSEAILYAGSGLPTCGLCGIYPIRLGPKRVLMMSYNQAGSEVVLAWSAPDNRLIGMFWAARVAVARTIDGAARSIPLAPELESGESYALVYPFVEQSFGLGSRESLLKSGCRPSGRIGEVVGQDTVLNYPTVVARYDSWRSRTFLWMAPDLGCFALRARVEGSQNGSWVLVSEKKALNVTLNHN